MSLAEAKFPDPTSIVLPPGPPYECVALGPLAGVPFELPAGDERLIALHRGEPSPSPALDNLEGAMRAWGENPDWMAFLDPESPCHHDKMVERALYLERWGPLLPPKARVLDLGGGVGRLMIWLLEQGCDVELVDPDLRSLWRAVSAAVGLPGRLDVHWSTGEHLPELEPVDVVVCCEVLCYVEDPRKVVTRLMRVLRPGGLLLCSVEARYGWALAPDVLPGSIEAFLGDGIVHVPGDRWVRTYTEEMFRSLLSPFEDLHIHPGHYAFSGPLEMATGPMEIPEAIALEARLRHHPLIAPLNRTWIASARRPLVESSSAIASERA